MERIAIVDEQLLFQVNNDSISLIPHWMCKFYSTIAASNGRYI